MLTKTKKKIIVGRGVTLKAYQKLGAGEQAWHILYDDQTVGKIKINPVIGTDGKTRYFLGAQIGWRYRSRGIGPKAGRLALKKSGLKTIYVRIKKSNSASARAAQKVGFRLLSPKARGQLIMVWRKK